MSSLTAKCYLCGALAAVSGGFEQQCGLCRRPMCGQCTILCGLCLTPTFHCVDCASRHVFDDMVAFMQQARLIADARHEEIAKLKTHI